MSRWMLDVPVRPFKNTSAETIPPFSVMRVTGSVLEQNESVIQVAKPNADSETITPYSGFAFNDGTPVAASGYGKCQLWYPALAVVNSSSVGLGTPVGPLDGSWELSALSKNARWYVSLDDVAKAHYKTSTRHTYFVLPEKSGGELFLTTSTITAKTGSSSPWTPGSGSATQCEFYLDGSTVKVRTTSITGQTLRHMGDSDIASGRVVQAKLVKGYWLIDVDYCS